MVPTSALVSGSIQRLVSDRKASTSLSLVMSMAVCSQIRHSRHPGRMGGTCEMIRSRKVTVLMYLLNLHVILPEKLSLSPQVCYCKKAIRRGCSMPTSAPSRWQHLSTYCSPNIRQSFHPSSNNSVRTSHQQAHHCKKFTALTSILSWSSWCQIASAQSVHCSRSGFHDY